MAHAIHFLSPSRGSEVPDADAEAAKIERLEKQNKTLLNAQSRLLNDFRQQEKLIAKLKKEVENQKKEIENQKKQIKLLSSTRRTSETTVSATASPQENTPKDAERASTPPLQLQPVRTPSPSKKTELNNAIKRAPTPPELPAQVTRLKKRAPTPPELPDRLKFPSRRRKPSTNNRATTPPMLSSKTESSGHENVDSDQTDVELTDDVTDGEMTPRASLEVAALHSPDDRAITPPLMMMTPQEKPKRPRRRKSHRNSLPLLADLTSPPGHKRSLSETRSLSLSPDPENRFAVKKTVSMMPFTALASRFRASSSNPRALLTPKPIAIPARRARSLSGGTLPQHFNRRHTVCGISEDSPFFRENCAKFQHHIDELQTYLKQMAHAVGAFSREGKGLARRWGKTANTLASAPAYTGLLKKINKRYEHTYDVKYAHMILGKVLARTKDSFFNLFRDLEQNFVMPMEEFIDLEVKSTSKLEEKVNDRLTSYSKKLRKLLSLRNKELGRVPELSPEVQREKREYEDARFEYIKHLNLLTARKNFKLVESVRTCIATFSKFFSEGVQYCNRLGPLLRRMEASIQEQLQAAVLDESIWNSKRSQLDKVLAGGDEAGLMEIFRSSSKLKRGIICQGFLFKRSRNVATTKWKRRWFYITNGKFYYYRRKQNAPVWVCDMALCTVRERVGPQDYYLSFEIITPNKDRAYVLQADSMWSFKQWLTAIRQCMQTALEDHGGGSTQLSPAASAIMAANPTCADCNAKNPDWASTNLGIVICLQCSGVHRSLGANDSQVRSLTLDAKLWTPTLNKVVLAIGNAQSNRLWGPPLTVEASASTAERAEQLNTYIRNKYLHKKYAPAKPSDYDANAALHKAAVEGNVVNILQAQVWGGDLDCRDKEGRTALMKASEHNHDNAVWLLCHRGAHTHYVDLKLGKSALEYAQSDVAKKILDSRMKTDFAHSLTSP